MLCRYRKIPGDVCEGGVSERFLPPSGCGKYTCIYTYIRMYVNPLHVGLFI